MPFSYNPTTAIPQIGDLEPDPINPLPTISGSIVDTNRVCLFSGLLFSTNSDYDFTALAPFSALHIRTYLGHSPYCLDHNGSLPRPVNYTPAPYGYCTCWASEFATAHTMWSIASSSPEKENDILSASGIYVSKEEYDAYLQRVENRKEKGIIATALEWYDYFSNARVITFKGAVNIDRYTDDIED